MSTYATAAADVEWLDEPVIGSTVRTRSRKYGTESVGIYIGVAYSDWESPAKVPYHYFIAGEIGGTAQRCFGFPADPDTPLTTTVTSTTLIETWLAPRGEIA